MHTSYHPLILLLIMNPRYELLLCQKATYTLIASLDPNVCAHNDIYILYIYKSIYTAINLNNRPYKLSHTIHTTIYFLYTILINVATASLPCNTFLLSIRRTTSIQVPLRLWLLKIVSKSARPPKTDFWCCCKANLALSIPSLHNSTSYLYSSHFIHRSFYKNNILLILVQRSMVTLLMRQ